MFLSLLDLLRAGGEVGSSAPALDLVDLGTVLELRAALTGIDPKSVQVQLTEHTLAMGGSRTVEERTESPQSYRYQKAVSQFYRELPLPCRINPYQAGARWEAVGQLVVTLPKA